MNGYVQSDMADSDWAPHKVMHRLSDMVDPAPTSTFILIDEDAKSINNGRFVPFMGCIYPRTPARWGFMNWPAACHNGSARLNFGDGHAETKNWQDPRTRKTQPGVNSDNTAPSPNNEDCYWLGLRTTSLVSGR